MPQVGPTLKNIARPFTPPIIVESWRRYRRAMSGQIGTEEQLSRPGLPTFSLSELFPDIGQTSVCLPVDELQRHSGMLPLQELLTLAAICSYVKPQNVLEIGTFRGSSTLLMAMHVSSSARIFTLDLPPDDAKTVFDLDMGNIAGVPFVVGERYRGTKLADKITQLYGDSALFDFTPYYDQIDLIFVDGNHEYENVRADTETAFRLVRAGGVIVWDDYDPVFGSGVMRALHEVSNRMLHQVSGTRFAIYQHSN